LKNIKFIIYTLILFLLSLNLFGIDFGGNLDNITTLNWEDDFSVDEKLKLSIWLETQINPKLNFSTKGSYAFSYANEEPDHIGDLDRLVLNGNFDLNRMLFKFSTGRFLFNDFSQLLLNHKLDGVI
jgi:hypothetical protein